MQAFHEAFPENSGRSQYAPAFPDYVEDVVLQAGILARLPIPPGARFALFSFDGDVRVKLGDAVATFALPSATTTNGAGSELNPGMRRIAGLSGRPPSAATHLCLLAPAASTGSVSFYA